MKFLVNGMRTMSGWDKEQNEKVNERIESGEIEKDDANFQKDIETEFTVETDGKTLNITYDRWEKGFSINVDDLKKILKTL